MMPGLPVCRLGTIVGHWVNVKTVGKSEKAYASTHLMEALNQTARSVEHGCVLLIQDQHIVAEKVGLKVCIVLYFMIKSYNGYVFQP